MNNIEVEKEEDKEQFDPVELLGVEEGGEEKMCIDCAFHPCIFRLDELEKKIKRKKMMMKEERQWVLGRQDYIL